MRKDKSLESHFVGKKREVLPTFNLLLRKIKSFGSDISMNVAKGYISFSRSKCFAVVHIGTTSITLEFAAEEELLDDRLDLVDTCRWSGRINRSLRIKSIKDIDSQLVGWLKKAYKISK